MQLRPEQLAEIGQRLRLLRDRRGQTQAEMAELLGMSRSYYAKVELGRSSISVGKLFDFADILSADRDWLVWGDEVPVSDEVRIRRTQDYAGDLDLRLAQGVDKQAEHETMICELERRMGEAQIQYRANLDDAVLRAWRLANDDEFRAQVQRMAQSLGVDEEDVVVRLIGAR